MNPLLACVGMAGCLAVSVARTSAAEVTPRSAADPWPTATPEELGFDSAPLLEMFDFVRERRVPVHSVQLVRHGRMCLDAYFYPYDGKTRHDVASVTKSITSTLVGLAIAQGHLPEVKQPVLSLFPELPKIGVDPRARALTLEHLLTMQSGWDCGTHLGDPRINVDARLAEMRRTSDWARYALNLPFTAEPGTRFAYCNANCHLLSALITRGTGTNALAFARRALFEPLGIHDVAWRADPRGNNYGWGDLQLHPHDMARIGQLFLQRGRWNGREIIPESWIRLATREHVSHTGNDDRYGYYWWLPGDEYPGLFEAVGRGGQRITIWPAKDLVLVFTGGGFETDHLAAFIVKALKSDKSLPANPEANRQLRGKIAAATQAPAPQPSSALPRLVAVISGKTFKLSTNELGLGTLALHFSEPGRAQLELLWEGHRERYPVGLDDVERFATNSILRLPVGCKGRWLNDDTFFLSVDLVGGINFYRFTLRFADKGRSVRVALGERTGLNEENFEGEAQR